MGGTHIGCGVVCDDQLLASTSLDSQRAESLATLLPSIAETLLGLLHEAGLATRQCSGLAIGFPGIVDARDGRIFSTLKKYDDATHIDLNQWSQQALGLPLRIENDARMALLGEQYAGAARGVQDVIMITLGTGIGSAAMMQGKLVRGVHHHAGCMGGHLPVDFQGHRCACGNIGCAEAEAAGWSLPKIIREAPGFAESSLSRAPSIDFQTLFSAAELGDRLACDIRQRCLNVWASNTVASIHAYDPEIIVFGGGVMRSGEVILPFVRQYVEEHAWTTWGTPCVVAATLGENAALLGAVPLLSENLSVKPVGA